MIMLVKFIGIFIACMGFLVLLNPGFMKGMITYWKQGKRLYMGGVLRVLFGIVFLLSASQARFSAVMYVLGIFSLITGSLVFILGPEKIKTMLDRWDKKPHSVLRIFGILIIAIGALIIYSA